MQTLLIITIIILIAGFAATIYFLTRKKEEPEKEDNQTLLLMQQQLQNLRETLDNKLSESQKQLQSQFHESQRHMQNQFGQTAQIVKNVTEKLTKLDETNKQVVGFAEQLQSLENILKNPKKRGILGEYYLETLLKNVFAPSQYQMQYKFTDGEIVDAVIFIKDNIIPIDSKFSLENYNKIVEEKDPARHEQLEKQFKQDLKNRIDETSKYIRPSEKTTDFAFMFIPSEGIYYDLLVNTIGFPLTDPQIRWLSESDTALLAVIIMAAWQWIGFNTVLFLAGLQNIPRALYEAATVDGASPRQQFWKVTLPLLGPTTFFVVTTTIIQAMQVFEQVFIIMGQNPAGPGNSTLTIVLYLYQKGFQRFEQGYASAIAWVLFLLIFGATLFQFQRQRTSGTSYEG